MTAYSEMTDQERHHLEVACAYLFSPVLARDRSFVIGLNRSMIKKAFREKAKRYHPDLHENETEAMLRKRKERFVKIKQSYDYLVMRVPEQDSAPEKPSPPPRVKRPLIIAVGGAKGGIGKSILAANLSVYLSGKGIDTVAADLDLGGANLHLYLGRTRLKRNINDFFDNPDFSLADIMETTDYGPRLIGGDSARLGAANIPFGRKLKLLKAIRTIDADCVIVDLGGDTSYNILDFFLSADQQIIVTTCDPASYLEAYTFIKVALYRKLNRLSGPESDHSRMLSEPLKQLIKDMTMPRDGHGANDLAKVLEKVRHEYPTGARIMEKAIASFSPQIIVNKATDDLTAGEPVKRIQQVAGQKLLIKVNHLCNLPLVTGIERSARTLVPWVATERDGTFARLMGDIRNALFVPSTF